MKVGFCGSHGTGKTSVAVGLAERMGYRLVTSASRRVHALGYDINDKASVVSQAATSMARLAAQVDAGFNFISDRTLLDSMAYNEYQLEHMWADDPKAQFWYDTMDIITAHMMNDYDIVIYFPITFPLIEDGVRATDLEYQADIDRRIKTFLEKYRLKVYTMPNGEVQDRIDYMERLISEIAATSD